MTTSTGFHEGREMKETAGFLAAGSFGEAICGAAAVVLTILALVGLVPVILTSIGAILVGAALLFQGGSVAAKYNELTHRVPSGEKSMAEFGGGISVEFLGGVAGIVLGILSLFGIATITLLPIAVIALGSSVFLGASVVAGLNRARIYASNEPETSQRAAHESTDAAARVDSLVGAGAVVLGILALIGVAHMTLTIVGILALGAGILLSGSAVGAKMVSVLR